MTTMTAPSEHNIEIRLSGIEVRLDSMATKEDLARIEARLDTMATKEDLAVSHGELATDNAKIREEIQKVRTEIAELRYQIVRWIVGAVTVASSVGLVGMAILDRLG